MENENMEEEMTNVAVTVMLTYAVTVEGSIWETMSDEEISQAVYEALETGIGEGTLEVEPEIERSG